MNISLKSVLYGGFKISKASSITIDEYSVIGHNITLDGRNGICIGKNVNISSGGGLSCPISMFFMDSVESDILSGNFFKYLDSPLMSPILCI